MSEKTLSPMQLGEVRSFERLIREEKLKLALVSGNTLLVKGGKKWVETQTDIVNLLEGQKQALLNRFFSELGFPEGAQLSLDLETGKVWMKKQ